MTDGHRQTRLHRAVMGWKALCENRVATVLEQDALNAILRKELVDWVYTEVLGEWHDPLLPVIREETFQAWLKDRNLQHLMGDGGAANLAFAMASTLGQHPGEISWFLSALGTRLTVHGRPTVQFVREPDSMIKCVAA